MPTYQYVCTECGEPLEAVQSFTDAALTTCPVCGGQLRKVFSAVGVVFKGSGFYRNDSRTASGSKVSSGSSSDSTSSGSDGSSSSDSTSDSGKTEKKSSDTKPSSDSSSSAKPAATPAKPSGSGSAA